MAAPMDMEWAKDGLDGKLYIVQARPETVASQRRPTTLERYVLGGTGEVLATGRAVGEKIAAGRAHVIAAAALLGEFKPGEVLIADTTSPDWEPVMKTAGGHCHRTAAGAPATPPSSRASSGFPPWSVPTRHRRGA